MRDMAGRGHTGSLDDNVHDSMVTNGLCFEVPGNLVDTAAYDQPLSPYARSPWSVHMSGHLCAASSTGDNSLPYELVGSLVREEGHIYSLAATKNLLYTGSDSKNVRVWKNQSEYAGFKSNSGLVKAIVTSGDRIFTGHQDGRIRVWKYIIKTNGETHKRVTTLPTLRHCIKAVMKPSNYIEVKKKRSALWIKHVDCISCLSLTEDQSFLYSASWDKTFKVWRTSDFKCLESVKAHSDAVNSLIAGFSGYVFTGSADGTVKVWSRELRGKSTKHTLSKTLLNQDYAVTSLTLNSDWSVLYSGSSNGSINFWERDKALAHGGVLRGHKLGVLCLAAAGSLIFSGSADMSIRMWRRSSHGDHVCLSILAGHTGPVKCLAVEEDYELKSASEKQWVVYSGSLDKSVKIWRVIEHS